MSPRPKRRSSISDLRERIIIAAWEQMALEGAPALSLRAIARSLNISAPSIYNYFPDRDALVTALIVDAHNSTADFLEQAISSISENDHAERIRRLGLAYRQWAITYPERFHLIYGTPIAGYSTPLEITNPPAGRSLTILVNALKATYTAGKLFLDISVPVSNDLESMLNEWRMISAPGVDNEVLYIALSIWVRVHGLVSLEIGNQFPPFIHHPVEVYRRELDIHIKQYIKE